MPCGIVMGDRNLRLILRLLLLSLGAFGFGGRYLEIQQLVFQFAHFLLRPNAKLLYDVYQFLAVGAVCLLNPNQALLHLYRHKFATIPVAHENCQLRFEIRGSRPRAQPRNQRRAGGLRCVCRMCRFVRKARTKSRRERQNSADRVRLRIAVTALA